MRWKRSDSVMLIIITTIYSIAIFIRPNTYLYDQIYTISEFWRDLAQNTSSALLIAFLVCLVGNFSFFIGFVPFPLIIFDLSKYYDQWWLLAIVAGCGSGVGEIFALLFGKILRKSKNTSVQHLNGKFTTVRQKIEKRPSSIPLSVFLFALTPLPDDMIMIPLGMSDYSWKKMISGALLPCILGKTIMMIIIAFLGHMIESNAEFLNELIIDNPILFFLRLVVPSETINPTYDLVQFSLIFWIMWILLRTNFKDEQNPLFKKIMEIEEVSYIYKKCPTITKDKHFQKCLARKNSVKGFEKCYDKHIYKKGKCDVKYGKTIP